MTKQEAAIITAYTGVLIGSFSEFHKLVEELLGRQIWTHELSSKATVAELKEKAHPLFITMDVS